MFFRAHIYLQLIKDNLIQSVCEVRVSIHLYLTSATEIHLRPIKFPVNTYSILLLDFVTIHIMLFLI